MSGAPHAHPAPRPATRPCPLCGGRRADRWRGAAVDAGAHRPVACGDCGMVFIDPIPPAALAPGTYGTDYYEPWQGREARPRRRLWRRRLRAVERHAAAGALLDVGCGDGAFLETARRAGWRAEGIEFSPEGARRAARRIGGPVAVGDLTRESFLPGPFDVVTLWHVLEHLADPAAMLAAIGRRLRPGGLLVAAVPNLDNYPMRAAYRVARGRALPLYEPGAREPHVNHFSPRTLRLMLSRCGYRVAALEPDRCALTLPKRLLDTAASALSLIHGGALTDAIAAFAVRSP